MVIHQTEASPLRLPCSMLPLGTIALRFGKGGAEVTQDGDGDGDGDLRW